MYLPAQTTASWSVTSLAFCQKKTNRLESVIQHNTTHHKSHTYLVRVYGRYTGEESNGFAHDYVSFFYTSEMLRCAWDGVRSESTRGVSAAAVRPTKVHTFTAKKQICRQSFYWFKFYFRWFCLLSCNFILACTELHSLYCAVELKKSLLLAWQKRSIHSNTLWSYAVSTVWLIKKWINEFIRITHKITNVSSL